MSKEFEAYLTSRGIKHQLTIPYSPEQNGVAERLNRTLMESARAMMSHANLPNSFWAEAVATAVYLRNRSESSALKEDMTPYEKWYGRKPDVSHLRVFGCIAYSHIPDSRRRKLDKKAQKYQFVGYCKDSKGYRLFDAETRTVVKRRDVVFNEFNFDINSNTDTSQQTTLDLDSDTEPEQNHSESEDARPQVRQSSRPRNQPVRFGFNEYADVAAVDHFAFKAGQVLEPRTIEEALSGDDADKWRAAAYSSLLENQTWDLVELPHDREAIPCKWVFKMKYKEDGSIERYKARPVAKGYAQQHGVDYDETFSPVVRFSSIRVLLSFALQQNMHVHQMDVVTAFLHGKLEEEIYMTQPSGYSVKGKDYISIHQKQYIHRLLERFGMKDAKPVSTPADISVKLTKDDGVSNEVDSTEYQSLVGSLIYAAIATRPDISQAVGTVSKFCSNPTQSHHTAAKRILRYLKNTADTALTYSKSSCASLIGYSDADWAGDLDTRRSTSGVLFLMSNGAVSWASKAQPVVALSSSEAEYIALSMAAQEATWMQKLLDDLHVCARPVKIMEDNQGAIAIAKNPVAHARTKHIDIRFHYVRQAVEEGNIEIEYCPTEMMIADLLTKPLSKEHFERLRQMMGLVNLTN